MCPRSVSLALEMSICMGRECVFLYRVALRMVVG